MKLFKRKPTAETVSKISVNTLFIIGDYERITGITLTDKQRMKAIKTIEKNRSYGKR